MSTHNSNISNARLTDELFEKAVKLAKYYGHVTKNKLPDIRNSDISNSYVTLRDSSNRYIYRLSLSSLQGIGIGGRSSAVAWARSMGYPVPTKPDGCLSALLCGIGFAVFIVPGILIAIWLWNLSNQYERDMNALVARWVDAGRPEPGIKQNVELEATVPSMIGEDIESKLEKIAAMKEKGLISDSEFEALRKRALGID